MEQAIEKILENFVFGDIDIEYYTIDDYPTEETNEKEYDVKVFVSPGIDMVDAETLQSRLETGLKMLGFYSINDVIIYLEDVDKLLIRSSGKVKIK